VRVAVDLAELTAPDHTAVLTMELQRGVVGDLATLPDLHDAAADVGMPANAGRICRAARAVGAPVVHCNAVFRPDRRGSAVNCRMLAASMKLAGDTLDIGSPGTENLPELEVAPSDLVIERSHGLTPFVATELDQLLRNLGVTTVVAVGNSLNVGIIGLVLNAVDLGYQVVVPADAVVGVPVEYGEQIMTNSVSLLATVVETDELVAAWPSPS
jgi:nicotinamidase-related amidase